MHTESERPTRPMVTEMDEPMTDAQAHRLKALAWQLGIPAAEGVLSRGEAARRIAELERRL